MEILLAICTLVSTLFKAAGSYFALVLADYFMQMALNNGGYYLIMYIPGFIFIALAIFTLWICGVEFKALVDLYIFGGGRGNRRRSRRPLMTKLRMLAIAERNMKKAKISYEQNYNRRGITEREQQRLKENLEYAEAVFGLIAST